MIKKIAIFFLIVSFLVCANGNLFAADSPLLKKPGETDNRSLEERVRILEEKLAKNVELEKQVAELSKENTALKNKLSEIENQVVGTKHAPDSNAIAPAEKTKTILDTVKFQGRFATGFLKQEAGNPAYTSTPSYSHGSFEAPEAKLQITLQPDPNNTLVARANLNNAAWNSLDTFCLDSNVGQFLPFPENFPFTIGSRIGRFKIPFGEEYWTNDMVQSATTDNSAGNPGGYDEGIRLSGTIGKDRSLLYWFSVTNGQGTGSSTATTRDNYGPKAVTGRLGYQIVEPLYVSASVYNSGDLGTSTCDVSFGGTTSAPMNATGWSRTLWEIDIRYDIGKGKNKGGLQGAYSDGVAYLRGAFGQAFDQSEGVGVADRDADYGSIEALWNFHPKFYLAGRYSIIEMQNDYAATLNTLQYVKQYQRYSIALGYRWSEKTIIRLAYQFNVATMASSNPTAADGANDDLLMVTVGTIF